MGAQSDHRIYYDKELSHEEVEKKFDEDIEADISYNGTRGYTGTISQSSRLQFSDKTFNTEEEAEEYACHEIGVLKPRDFLEQFTSKNISTAVRFKDGWLVGGSYSW